ncbi:MAG: TonB-dependent receptor [Proteobacteria bacterium]|nr:TonB-dependent receptor [Pseudomonadota bacterium]
MKGSFRPTRLSSSIAAALLALAHLPHAVAAEPNVESAASGDAAKLETIIITAKSGAYRMGEKGTASAVAPSQSSLNATQPQSIITREFIESSVTKAAEYSRVVNIAPSVSGDSANGPGLSETKTTMRGFSDDQYNITFDGIPWGDTNNPAHHSTSFFPASVIGAAIVERGPGNASNLGYATFGGTISLFSKKPLDQREIRVFGAAGTWNTRLLGASYESGRLPDWNNGTVQLNFQHLESDGYLTYNSIKSDNFTVKIQRQVGDASTFTLFSSINRIHYTQPDNNKGPTLAQVALYGKNYILNNDPTSFNYFGYNHTTKDTDLDYLRLKTAWGNDWTTEATLYTYAYNNQTISSTDPTGLTKPGTVVGPKGNADIPGIDKQNKYRVYGTTLKASKELTSGLLSFGVWAEKSDTDRHQYDLDLTLGNIRDPRETKPTPLTFPSVLFDQQSKITTAQPYAEFEWQVTPSTTVTPGIKNVSITRSVDAIVNQTTRVPQNASLDYDKTLPFLTINQKFGNNLSAYMQYAKGFQIPDLKSFYIADPTKNSSDPQLSTNYQLGIVGKTANLVWDLDIYKIDFKNKYVSNGLGGAAAAYVNVGGATYKGIEGQVTYMVGSGFALYANGSVNEADAIDTGKTISGSPNMTAALGVLYSGGPWTSSLIYKRTGTTYQQDYDATKPAAYDYYKTEAYENVDFGVSYTFREVLAGMKLMKLQFNVFNLLDQQKVTSISPGKTLPGDQYTYQAPRSVQFSLRADF